MTVFSQSTGFTHFTPKGNGHDSLWLQSGSWLDNTVCTLGYFQKIRWGCRDCSQPTWPQVMLGPVPTLPEHGWCWDLFPYLGDHRWYLDLFPSLPEHRWCSDTFPTYQNRCVAGTCFPAYQRTSNAGTVRSLPEHWWCWDLPEHMRCCDLMQGLGPISLPTWAQVILAPFPIHSRQVTSMQQLRVSTDNYSSRSKRKKLKRWCV